MKQRAPLTEDFQSVATMELARLQSALEQLNARHVDATRVINEIEQEIGMVLRTKTDLEEMLGLSSQLPIGVERKGVGGKELRDRAVEILADSGIDTPIHYRDWFELVESRGIQVGGRNPLATFLAQITQHEGVRGVGRKTGLYEIIEPESERLPETDLRATV